MVKFASIRILFALVAHYNLELHQMDVVTAFLQGDLEEEVFIEVPEGVTRIDRNSTVCKLLRALFGLKQSPRRWNMKIDAFLTKDLQFCAVSLDPCLYARFSNEGVLLLTLYVDDLLVAGSCAKSIVWIKGEFSRRFEMKDIGEAKLCLGLEITRDRKNKKLFLTQSAYVSKVLQRFALSECVPEVVPLQECRHPENRLGMISGSGDDARFPYRMAIGTLMYLMICTRPDIAFAVGKLAQFGEQPAQEHWVAVKHLLKYVAGTKHHCILYDGQGDLTLKGYCDADWGGDVRRRKSTSGCLFKLGGGAVSWCSKKKTCITLSTCEAEYVSMCLASKETISLARFL